MAGRTSIGRSSGIGQLVFVNFREWHIRQHPRLRFRVLSKSLGLYVVLRNHDVLAIVSQQRGHDLLVQDPRVQSRSWSPS
jgi:hypothetical protein